MDVYVCAGKMSGVRARLSLRSPPLQRRTWKLSRRERLTSNSWRYEPSVQHFPLNNAVTYRCAQWLIPSCPLQADIMDVNQIFKDLAVMIHDQGEMIGKSNKLRLAMS